ncbi:Derepression protein, partial [Enterobacter hormaechei]|nr:Derepression protein [Enterobacter hormaechei]HAS1461313.1 Derepression protein [Enterobacter hormaechei]HAS1490097.1 Derepression protein [Enterobacter hormaechei]
MHNTQSVSARRDVQEHLSPESFHKLNRASAMTHFVG